MKQESCYMCSKPAVSIEHVPPKCLFPEQKDVKTTEFRKNLITVPSCEFHNASKSKDDEFLMSCLSGLVGNNYLAYLHFQTKVKRAYLRNQGSFLRMLMQNFKRETITNHDGKTFTVLKGNINFSRFEKCLQNITYGIYFHEYKTKFEGELNIFIDNPHDKYDLKQLIYRDYFVNIFEDKSLNFKKEGANPEIFYYEFCELSSYKTILLRMTFYEGLRVYVVF